MGLGDPFSVTVRDFIEVSQTVAEISRFNGF